MSKIGSTLVDVPTPISAGDARYLSEVLNRIAFTHERFTLTRHGRPVAAIVSLEDLRKLEAAGQPEPPAPFPMAVDDANKDGP